MKPETVEIPFEQLDPVAPLVQEDEDTPGKHVLIKLVADDSKQPVVSLAKINWLTAKKDRRRARKA